MNQGLLRADLDFARALNGPAHRGAAPALVYLDQWCWHRLARDRAGEPTEAADTGIFEAFRRLASEGFARFVLSQAHYRENWVRKHIDARWDTAVVMAELSGLCTITSVGLGDWDAECGVAAHYGLERPETPSVFGWGVAHCFTGRTVAARIIDTSTGRSPSWSDLSAERRTELLDLEQKLAYRLELAILGRRDPEIEQQLGLRAFAPTDDDKGSRLCDEDLRLQELFARNGRRASEVRDTIAFLAYRDSQQSLSDAATRLGVDPQRLFVDIAGDDSSGMSDRLHAFMDRLPISRTHVGLRVAAHRKDSFGFLPSDSVDFWYVATVMPFVDVVVADKRTFNLVQERDLAAEHGTVVARRLQDVVDHVTR